MRELTRNEQSELNDMDWHWGSAYGFAFDGEVFSAARHGEPHQVLTADSPWELRYLVRSDYEIWSRLRAGRG